MPIDAREVRGRQYQFLPLTWLEIAACLVNRQVDAGVVRDQTMRELKIKSRSASCAKFVRRRESLPRKRRIGGRDEDEEVHWHHRPCTHERISLLGCLHMEGNRHRIGS